jgi:predicted nucleotidyltransferase
MDLVPFLGKLRQLCRENDIAMLGVFGSVARGEDSPNSDIDLLVKLNKPIGLVGYIQLEDKPVAILRRKVDLATEAALHPLIRQDIMKGLKILYENQKG